MKKVCFLVLCSVLAIAKAIASPPIKFYGTIVPNKIQDKYTPAYYQNIGGLLGYRLDVNLEKRLLKIDSGILLSGFKKRPGSQTWIGEHVGKFLFSASKTYAYTHDARLKQLMDEMVQKYIACQMPDGYLGTYLLKDRWTEWDVWAHKYAIIGLLNYYSVTGYKPALETAKRAADLICRTFGDEPGKRDLMISGEHNGLAPGSILEPMVDLYRYTHDAKYLNFCKYILRAFEQPSGPKMLSCFLGMLKYYKLTGEGKYLTLLQTAWTDITTKRLYITGTSSDHEIFRAPGILKAENDDKMGEGCVTVTWIQFNLALLQITGDPKYSEELERSVYNHLLAAENPQTGCVSYYTALQGIKPYRCDQGFSCCLSSVPRGISLIPEMMGGKINGVFTVLLYEKCETTTKITARDRTPVTLKVAAETKFPLEGKVDMVVNVSKASTFTINFRVPDWSENFMARVGGKAYHGRKGQLLSIERKWNTSDKVSISFDMPLQVIHGGASYPNAVAFKRGPQVLALDQGLNPELATLSGLIYEANEPVTDTKVILPQDWGWKEAYLLKMKSKDGAKDVVLVPFSEAGQKEGKVAVWVENILFHK